MSAPRTAAAAGRYGPYGGRFVAETLIAALDELEQAFEQCMADADFRESLQRELEEYVGRPTPLYPAERISDELGGAQICLKREDLNHTGAHKINNTVGQALLAKHMGKRRLIAETGAGQHGVATATVAARAGLECCVYMGEEDMRRQAINVRRMELLGAELRTVRSGSRTLKDALNEALRDWVGSSEHSLYVIGTAAGPHPYPMLVRELQSVIGREARRQCLARYDRLPDALVACVGGGSNAIGLFHPFLADEAVRMYGVEAGGSGLASGHHAASLCAGSPGVLHGAYSYLLQDEDGQVAATHSISAGLDYPAVGPEHAWLKDSGRVDYSAVADSAALEACLRLTRSEGILPALESSHALARAFELAVELGRDGLLLVNLSGRGDKDIEEILRLSAAQEQLQ